MSADAIHDEELSPRKRIMEAMGISQPAYEEVMGIIGRMPTVQELSTLLAMWGSSGSRAFTAGSKGSMWWRSTNTSIPAPTPPTRTSANPA